MTNTTVSEADNNFSELINRVGFNHERVLIERQGQAVVAIISPEDLRRLEMIEDAIDSSTLARAVAENDGFVTLESM